MVLRGIAIFTVSAGLALVVVAVGIANIASGSAPSRALRFYAFHGDALANQAFNVMQARTPDSVARAEQLARRAFDRDPTSVAAVRTLSLIQDVRGNRDRAYRGLRYALTLNRRDLLTHLWLIENYVQLEDTAGALRHYDMALRTSTAAHTILMPILIQASSDPGVREPLTKILATRPIWRPTFIREIIANASPVDAAVDLQRRLGSVGAPFSAQEDKDLAARLVTEERFDVAAQLLKRNADSAPVIDGRFDFRQPSGIFSWTLQANYSLGASSDVSASGGEDHVLSIFSAPGEGGEVARQLLILKPGRYRISSIANGLTAKPRDQARWLVTCAGRNGRDVGTVNLMGGSGGQASVAEFSVPDLGCAAQWLTLILKAPADAGIQAQVEKVEITPLR
jgi:tetratricopeptide (TPR) repeat protein